MTNHRKKFFTLTGIMIGVVVVHPYVMLVHYLTGANFAAWNARQQVTLKLFAAFSPDMLPMTIAFAFFGGVCGFFIGLLFERNQLIISYQYEARLHRDLTNSLQQLLAVVSHYILNSSLIISGNTRLLRKRAGGEDLAALVVIDEQVQKNETILKLMKETNFLQNITPTDSSYKQLMGLSKQIEAHLKE